MIIDENIVPDQEMVTIPKEEYQRLLKDSKKLNALENGGVDNWGGYDYAMENFYGEE